MTNFILNILGKGDVLNHRAVSVSEHVYSVCGMQGNNKSSLNYKMSHSSQKKRGSQQRRTSERQNFWSDRRN